MNDVNLLALSEIILPSGSTSTDLQAAVDSADLVDMIIISGDMPFSNTVIIPKEKEITIQSDEGNNWIMSQSIPNMRHFDVKGSLILQNIILDGENTGGGLSVSNRELLNDANLTINEGTIIQNCYTNTLGGAILLDSQSTLTMTGGLIRGNTAERGGAVHIEQEDVVFTMTGGSISGNRSESNGGGLFSVGSNVKIIMTGGSISDNWALFTGGGLSLFTTEFIMSGGEISGNTAGYEGGGAFLTYNSSLNMSGGRIINNTAGYKGGALSIYSDTFIMTGGIISGNKAETGDGGAITFGYDVIEITGESRITNNSAPNGDGGAINMEMRDYDNLIIGSGVVFSCNNAKNAHKPPEDASSLFPNMKFASTSISDHLMNNFDIYYTDGEPIEEIFHVTYNSNGGSGSYTGSEIVPGGTDIVLPVEETGISRAGHLFLNWNTEPDGSGTSYEAGDTIILDCSTVIFAQWVVTYTVTYDCNGGRGNYVDYCREFEIYYIVLSVSQTGISRINSIFTVWNTLPDGSGISYAAGRIIAINSDITLYAQWIQLPERKSLCRASITKCRRAIEGQVLWVDNDNTGNTRPPSVEIILLRDGEVYRRKNVDSTGDGSFGFCCVPVWRNSGHKYYYQIDETEITDYTKIIEGYTIINALAT